MSDNRILFFTEEWLAKYGELLSKNEAYKRAAKDWHGDFIFEVTPDGMSVKRPLRVYMDLQAGEMVKAHVAQPDETAQYVYSGSLENWKRLLAGEIGPIKGIMARKFRLQGSLMTVTRYIKAAEELVRTAALVPTRFPDE